MSRQILPNKTIAEQVWIKPVYILIFLLMGLTGFGQMPIFKRYYIADIPGLAWLDQYYVTHTIHYLGAIALLALIAYGLVIYGAMLRKQYRLTGCRHDTACHYRCPRTRNNRLRRLLRRTTITPPGPERMVF